ncbi:MAG: LysR family transcriptional regulator [Methylobacteriaceae bacterium]|nr:LysR family transcriptional regulator [Methylobacteriaceae bacterium]
MIDGLTLDQMRILLAAAREGSFSAAARRLGRAQSAVSYGIATLEDQLGIKLFDRSDWKPRLTAEGRALLADIQSIAGQVEALRAKARGLAGGLEPELGIVIDVMFPLGALTSAVAAFGRIYPTVPLRLSVEALGAVVEPVLDGRSAIGIMGSLPIVPDELARVRLAEVPVVAVAAPDHTLARERLPLPPCALQAEVQLVLTDRSTLTAGRDYGVMSARTWRLADLGAKHAFLQAGLGWGLMPRWIVEEDLSAGRLVALELEDALPFGGRMPMYAVYPRDRPPGPAGSWMIEHLVGDQPG